MATVTTISREKVIKALCAETKDGFSSDIANNIDFADIPMDSLDIMSAFQSVEDEFNIQILDEDMHKLRNLNELIAYLNKQNLSVTD